MPPVSEAQRRAMAAAAHGKSTLGIPRKVGREFLSSDKGGNLPKKKGDSSPKQRRNYAKGGGVFDTGTGQQRFDGEAESMRDLYINTFKKLDPETGEMTPMYDENSQFHIGRK